LASRITLACDALNAMTNDRPYRPAMTMERALEELRSGAGTQFDPHTVEALLAELKASTGPLARGTQPPVLCEPKLDL
jgi:HD-GYP domain-containing protein (c-di-GMP phosphodiesterase class II)